MKTIILGLIGLLLIGINYVIYIPFTGTIGLIIIIIYGIIVIREFLKKATK